MTIDEIRARFSPDADIREDGAFIRIGRMVEVHRPTGAIWITDGLILNVERARELSRILPIAADIAEMIEPEEKGFAS